MLFLLVLGMILGASTVVLLHQWLTGALRPTVIGSRMLGVDEFPRLAPPERPSAVRVRRSLRTQPWVARHAA